MPQRIIHLHCGRYILIFVTAKALGSPPIYRFTKRQIGRCNLGISMRLNRIAGQRSHRTECGRWGRGRDLLTRRLNGSALLNLTRRCCLWLFCLRLTRQAQGLIGFVSAKEVGGALRVSPVHPTIINQLLARGQNFGAAGEVIAQAV